MNGVCDPQERIRELEAENADLEKWAWEAKDLLAKVAVVVGYQSPGKPSSLQIEAARVLATCPLKGGE